MAKIGTFFDGKTGGKEWLKEFKNGTKKCAPKSAILRTVFHSFHSVM